jgi:autotransporter-associated beta strand protein
MAGATLLGDTVLIASAAVSTINLNGPSPNIAGITFSGSTNYTIAQGTGGGSLYLNNGSNNASVAVSSGSQTIGAPVTLQSSLLVSQATGSTLTISGAISGAGLSLTQNGPGTLVLSGANNYMGGTTVLAGTLDLASPNALLAGTSLTVGANAGLLFGGQAATIASAAPTASQSSVALKAAAVAQVLSGAPSIPPYASSESWWNASSATDPSGPAWHEDPTGRIRDAVFRDIQDLVGDNFPRSD